MSGLDQGRVGHQDLPDGVSKEVGDLHDCHASSDGGAHSHRAFFDLHLVIGLGWRDPKRYEFRAHIEALARREVLDAVDRAAPLNDGGSERGRMRHGRCDAAMLLHIRNLAQETHGSATIPALVWLIEAHDVPLGVADSGSAPSAVIRFPESPSAIDEWELNLFGFLSGESGMRTESHKVPGEVIERGPVVVHRIAEHQPGITQVRHLGDARKYLVALDLALDMEGPVLVVHDPVDLVVEVLDVTICSAAFGPTAFERSEAAHA